MLNSFNILVVDDEDMIREFITTVVCWDFPVTFFEAPNGNEAIEILKKHEIHLIICDYNMPNGNGRKVFEFSQKLPHKPKFLLVTSEHPSAIEDITKTQGCGHLDKPFEFEELSKVVSDLLEVIPVQKEKNEFVCIKKEFLKSIDFIPIDIFIMLKESHFVKFINGQKIISPTDKERLAKAKSENIYARISDLPNLLKEQQRLIFYSEVFPSQNLEHSFSMNHVKAELSKLGLKKILDDSELIDLTQKNLKTVFALSFKVRSFNGLLDWINSQEMTPKKLHSVLVTLFCNIILKNSKKTYDFNANLCFGYAAVLHDLNLNDYILQNEHRITNSILLNSAINKSDQETLKMHVPDLMPTIKSWAHCPKEVLTIIENHHEKPDGNGFPKHLTGKDIDEMSAIFNVAHEVTSFIWDKKNSEDFKIGIEKLANSYFGYKQFEEPLAILAKELILK